MAAGVVEESCEQSGSDVLIAKIGADIDATDASDGGVIEVRIAVEAADGYQHTVVDAAEQDFSGGVITVLAAGELIHEGIEEVETFGAGLGVEAVDAWDRKLDFPEDGHSSG